VGRSWYSPLVQEDKKNRGRRAMQRRRFLVFMAVFCLR
jgi:hypothetical protein